VVKRHLDLANPVPPAQQVDGQADFDAEAIRQRKGSQERRPGQAALTGQGLGGRPAGRTLDPDAGQPDNQTVTTP